MVVVTNVTLDTVMLSVTPKAVLIVFTSDVVNVFCLKNNKTSYHEDMYIQWNLSKSYLLGTSIYIQNRKVLHLYRLNQQRFPTLGLYLSSVYTGFCFIQGSVSTGSQ